MPRKEIKNGERFNDSKSVFKKLRLYHGVVVVQNGGGPIARGEPQDLLDPNQKDSLINFFNGACICCENAEASCCVLIRLRRSKNTSGKIVITPKEVGGWKGLGPRIEQLLSG